jgi:simple sugar transport system ATP-binding protein
MEGIVKSFFGIKANDNIHFDVRRGEIHTLLGENGAGKSTLMNVLCGLYTPESGTIRIDGREQEFKSPRDAIAAGIGMLHQHFMLIPSRTVWENVALGNRDLPQILPKDEIIGRIRMLSQTYGLNVDPRAQVWQLSIGEQQRAAIVKMLYRQAHILILDEPTAVVTPQEARHLFSIIRKMASEGHGIIFISHKLDEVMEISDRVTVLRKGCNAGTVSVKDATKEKLAEMMVGRRVTFQINKTVQNPGEAVVEVEKLNVRDDRDTLKVKDFSMILRKREILGLAGVSGNGQQELCEALSGLRKPDSGTVKVDGKDLAGRDPKTFLKHRVTYIPADRKGTGLVPNMNIRENIALRKYWKEEYTRYGAFIHWENIAGHTGRLVERFKVANPGLGYPVRLLSGGNMQKLMLARELSDNPRAIIAMQPTWGLDVGATLYVREILLAQRDRGAAILLVSDDLEEIFAVSDRVAVIYGGRIMGIVDDVDAITEEELGLMMAGTVLERYRVEAVPSGSPEDD